MAEAEKLDASPAEGTVGDVISKPPRRRSSNGTASGRLPVPTPAGESSLAELKIEEAVEPVKTRNSSRTLGEIDLRSGTAPDEQQGHSSERN
jgi:hypothetical protein